MGNRYLTVTAVVLMSLAGESTSLAWENLLKDPGFEKYELTRKGYYTFPDGAPWQDITLGRGSVQFDANDWKAPEQMTKERPLGFTPATTGYEGQKPDENTGRLIIQQDVINPEALGKPGQYYEAWVWLGGAGRDDDRGPDHKEESGGWEILFYKNADSSTWKESDAIETHRMQKDFFGKPGSFVQVHGFGKLPAGTQGARVRVWATTWGQASGPKAYDTEVALDNAHFAVIGAPNMLLNGDFELDDREAEFKGWSRPAQWPFPRNGLKPLRVIDVFKGYFDHGGYRPFYGGRWAYGYVTYLRGWRRDAFTFGQYVDNPYPDGTPMVLMFNWIQNTAAGAERQLRVVGTDVELVVDYRNADNKPLGSQGFFFNWPVPPSSANICRYDQNANSAFSPRMPLRTPAGTRRIGVNVNFMVNMPYKDEYKSINAAVDDFFLVPAEKPRDR